MASHVWKNKTALVTGVGPGTGKALVERFVEGGYRVGMIARNEERLEAIASEHGDAVLALPCDVTDTDALAGALAATKDAFGVPSVVIHNAVGGAFGDFTEIEPETLRRAMVAGTATASFCVQGFSLEDIGSRNAEHVEERIHQLLSIVTV